jgi:hypothetical protein
MITRSGKMYSNPTVVTTTTTTTNSVITPKWSHKELLTPLRLPSTQGGLHDLPKKDESWLPKFSGDDGFYGNSHWADFCDAFQFHQSRQEHPDVFLRIFVSSLTESARKWINRLLKGSIKNPEDLEQAFQRDWCEKENMDSLYSQYMNICKASSEGIRDFNDRFNLLLKKDKLSFSKEFVLQHYLNLLEGMLQFTLKDQSPSMLEEAQDLASRIEQKLQFEDYINQVNPSHSNDPKESSNEDVLEAEPKPLEVLEVRLMPPKRKWSVAFSNTNNVMNALIQHKPSEDLGMATQKKPDFEDALFVLDTPMLEDQDMSEANKSEETNSSISMSCILQRVKRIREMLEIPFLKKQDSDDQLPLKGIPTLLHAGHSDTDEQAPFLKDQDCPTFPLVGEDTDWDEFLDDAYDISEDSDKYGYPIKKRSNFIEGHKDVFKDIRVPSAIVVDENPWCFQCSESHWEDECPYSNGGHQQLTNIDYFAEGPQINITIEEHQEAIKEAARLARFAVINKLDQESKDKLKKKEFQVYRRKKLDQPSTDQTKEPPVDVILPKKVNAEGVDLNFDFEGALSKMLVTIPLREVIKVPSVKERFENFFQGTNGLLKDGTIGCFQNIPVTTTYEQKTNDSIKHDKAHDEIGPTPLKCSPEDNPVAEEENLSQIEWPTKEEYQRLIGDLKVQKSEPVKILRKEDSDQRQKSTKENYLQLIDRYKEREAGTIRESDVSIFPSQQDIFVAESHPPPSTQYTKVVQGSTNFKIKEYKEGDMVWMWDANRGKPTNTKDDNRFWLGPFKVGKRLVNDSYYLSTPEGRRHTLPVSRHLLKPHQGGGT